MSRLAASLTLASLLVASTANAEEPGPPARERPRVGVLAFGGAARATSFDFRTSGTSYGLGVAAAAPRLFARGAVPVGLGGVAELDYDALATEHGLLIPRGSASLTGELLVWRFHLGAGPSVGFMAIHRVSGSDGTPWSPTVGLHASVALDVLTIANFTLFVGGRAGVTGLAAGTSGPALGAFAGLRFDVFG